METPKAIEQSVTVEVPPSDPQSAGQSPPWLSDDMFPPVVSIAPVHRPSALAPRSLPPAEALHWSIVVLTLITAVSVLIGSCGGTAGRPKELLPIMIVTQSS